MGDLLVLVIDLHPVWWADHSLTGVVQSSLVLCNAHLLQNPLNKVTFFRLSVFFGTRNYVNAHVSRVYL